MSKYTVANPDKYRAVNPEILDADLTMVADAIRDKAGTAKDLTFPNGFVSAIASITGGGSVEGIVYVTFMSEDGTTELYKKPVFSSDHCMDPVQMDWLDTPIKEPTHTQTFAYSGWSLAADETANSSALLNVTENRTVYAAFKASTRYYTVRFFDGETLLHTVYAEYGSTLSYIPKKDGYNFIGWTPTIAAVTADVDYYAQWEESSWEISDSWEEIIAAAADGTYASKYIVGQYKPLNLGTEGVVNMQIVGINLDALPDGAGNAPLTFLAKEALATSHRMNPTRKGTTIGTGAIGGWVNCEMRKYLKETIKPLIPEAVRNAMKEVVKNQTSATQTLKSYNLQSSNEDIWIPSVFELTGSQGGSVIETGTNYSHENTYPAGSYNMSGSVVFQKTKVGESVASEWWMRTAKTYVASTTANQNASFNYMKTNGYVGPNYDPAAEKGVVIGFCI